MTQREIKTYLILKYGSIVNAIEAYVRRVKPWDSDYKIMKKYFNEMIERIQKKVDK